MAPPAASVSTCSSGTRLRLLATSEDAGEGGRRWTIPEGYDGLSGKAYLGYAHGAAGIADALLGRFEATGDGRFRDAVHGAARWLARQVVPVLSDNSGLGWPHEEGKPPVPAFWCQGAAGIGRFFLHAAALDLLPEADAPAADAARAAAGGTRWAETTQCHGLAGSFEFLLDVNQATGDRAYLVEARLLARVLAAFRTPSGSAPRAGMAGPPRRPGDASGAGGTIRVIG